MRVFIYTMKVMDDRTGKIEFITAISRIESVAMYRAYEMRDSVYGTNGWVIDDKIEQIETNNQHCEICLPLPPEYVKKMLRRCSEMMTIVFHVRDEVKRDEVLADIVTEVRE